MALRLLHWNANSLVAHLHELKYFLDTLASSPDIICIQETRLKPAINVNIKGYSVIRRDPQESERGVAIFVRNEITYTNAICYDNVEGISIEVETISGPLKIINLYVSPSISFDESFFQDIFELENVCVCGDFNAKSTLWGSPKSDKRGKSIENILQKSDLVVLNDGSPTRFHKNGSSHIDLTLCSPKYANKAQWDVLDTTCGSDHNVIQLELNAYVTYEQIVPERWLFKKADWNKFSSQCDHYISEVQTGEDLDALTSNITDAILKAANESIPKSSRKHRKGHAMFWNEKCKEAIKNRDRAKNALKIGSPESQFIEYKRLKAVATKTVKTEKRKCWRAYCSNLTHRSKLGNVWQVVKNMNNNTRPEPIPTLDSKRGTAKTNKDKANTFAKHFSKISSTANYSNTFKEHKIKFENENKRTFDKRKNSDSVLNVPFKMHEFRKALKKCKNTSPGKDQICYEMFRHMSDKSKAYVLDFFNKLWENGCVPSTWRHAIIIPILKPNKNKHDPSSYRPIALTSHFCKLMERILVFRLNWYFEKYKLLSRFQSGFRKQRNTIDQLLRLSDDIIKSLANKSCVLGVFIDFEKAYDMIWRNGVLYKLDAFGITGNTFNWIQSFLKGRSIQARVGTTLSDRNEVENGLPQGSVLSPLLFLVAINDVPLTSVKHSLFADDVALWKTGKNIKFMQGVVQKTLNEIHEWCNLWGFKISVSKSCFVLFKKGRSTPLQLTFNGEDVRREKKVKFLGVIFDQTLTWREHVNYLVEKCQKRINVLKLLTGSQWGASKETLAILYKTFVRSVIDYGCEVYHSASNSVMQKLDAIQSQCLRLICGAIRCTPVPALEVECGIPPLSLHREFLLDKAAAKYHLSPDNPTCECFEDNYLLHYGKFTPQGRPIKLKTDEAIIHLPKAFTNKTGDIIPPWEYHQPYYDTHLHNLFTKKAENPHILRTFTLEHISQYCTSLHIYTDGSKCDKRSGCAFYIPFLKHSKSLRLPDDTTVFMAEMIAILESLKCILTKPPLSCVIFSDSLSSIQTLENGCNNCVVHEEIKYCLYQLSCIGAQVTFCWIPSHIGINGNETADKLAKSATSQEMINFPLLKNISDINVLLKKRMMNKWQKQWDKSPKGRFYYRLQPSVSMEIKCIDVVRGRETLLSRLRFGKVFLADTLHMLGKQPNNTCDQCHVKETVAHFLLDCTKYEDHMVERNDKLITSNRVISVETLLGDPHCYNDVFEYVNKTGKNI